MGQSVTKNLVMRKSSCSHSLTRLTEGEPIDHCDDDSGSFRQEYLTWRIEIRGQSQGAGKLRSWPDGPRRQKGEHPGERRVWR